MKKLIPIISDKQFKRLKKFAPFFASYMRNGVMPLGYNDNFVSNDGTVLDLTVGRCCIVGEAHGFTHEYSDYNMQPCDLCYSYADEVSRLYMNMDKSMDDNEKKHTTISFLETMDELIDHFESEHEELIKN